MSDNSDFECECGYQFDEKYLGSYYLYHIKPVCPKCSSEDVVPVSTAEENRRINAQEEYNEGLRKQWQN